MTTLQEQIAQLFLAALSGSKEVDAEKLEHLRTLLATNKRPKAEDFIKIFALPAGGELK